MDMMRFTIYMMRFTIYMRRFTIYMMRWIIYMMRWTIYMMRYTILQVIDVHGIVYMWPIYMGSIYMGLIYTMLIYNCHRTVTIYMDYHEVVYNVNIGENKRFLWNTWRGSLLIEETMKAHIQMTWVGLQLIHNESVYTKPVYNGHVL
jgi:hypothetical protein